MRLEAKLSNNFYFRNIEHVQIVRILFKILEVINTCGVMDVGSDFVGFVYFLRVKNKKNIGLADVILSIVER